MEGTMTEFEENVSFDADDPDFAPKVTRIVVTQTVLRSVHFTDITFGVDKREYYIFHMFPIMNIIARLCWNFLQISLKF